jgi:dihydropteroate synthase
VKGLLQPIVVTRKLPIHDRAQPLAGSRYVGFRDVVLQGKVQTTPLSEGQHQTLTSLRPMLCGLTLDRPRIMGILNITPDSFSDGGDLPSVASAVARAQAMVLAGVDILDIGGESTRPGAADVSIAEEIRRTEPVINAVRAAGVTIPISIDTRKTAVARAAIAAGADMVNDVSAFRFDPELADLVAETSVFACLMHSKGDPASMQKSPQYRDVLAEVYDHLAERIEFAQSAGIARDNLIVDPGIGFGKTLQHNLSLLRGLSVYHGLGVAILLGASRKKFIGSVGGAQAPKDRMPGSLAVALHGAAMGVQVLRVHDVVETKQALELWQAIHAGETEE